MRNGPGEKGNLSSATSQLMENLAEFFKKIKKYFLFANNQPGAVVSAILCGAFRHFSGIWGKYG